MGQSQENRAYDGLSGVPSFQNVVSLSLKMTPLHEMLVPATDALALLPTLVLTGSPFALPFGFAVVLIEKGIGLSLHRHM